MSETAPTNATAGLRSSPSDCSAARHRMKLAKLNLYSALLALPNEQLTVNEVEIGYRLALGGQVQEHLEQHMSKPQNAGSDATGATETKLK